MTDQQVYQRLRENSEAILAVNSALGEFRENFVRVDATAKEALEMGRSAHLRLDLHDEILVRVADTNSEIGTHLGALIEIAKWHGVKNSVWAFVGKFSKAIVVLTPVVGLGSWLLAKALELWPLP